MSAPDLLQVTTKKTPKTRQLWMIRVTYSTGENDYLRRPTWPIVQFKTRRDAEIHMDMIQPGLDSCSINVVPYDATKE